MNDHEIRQGILKKLNGTSFKLLHLERNHKAFGNMIAKIKSENKEYDFISDRGDIYCNDDIIFTASYHITGEDDSPVYLLKAIEQLILVNDKKIRLDENMKKLSVQPVGNGYIDCICPFTNVEPFIDSMNKLNIKITGFTWWCLVIKEHEPCAMGGPRSIYGSGWYSEIPPMSEVHEFLDNEAIKNYLLNEWPSSIDYKSCFTPAFWLDVPDDWKNSWS
jgi:hypothetical protein